MNSESQRTLELIYTGQDIDGFCGFVQSLSEEVGTYEYEVKGKTLERSLVLLFSSEEQMEEFVDLILNSYAQLGFTDENFIDIYNLEVYTSNVRVFQKFSNQRMNIISTWIESVGDIANSDNREVSNLKDTLETMDTLNVLNYIHKFKEILNVLVAELEDAGISVGDKINKIAAMSLH